MRLQIQEQGALTPGSAVPAGPPPEKWNGGVSFTVATQCAFGKWDVWVIYPGKICLHDSLENFMTHINCKVYLHTQLSAACTLQGYKDFFFPITSKYLKDNKLYNFLTPCILPKHTQHYLWGKIHSIKKKNLYMYINLTIIKLSI